MKRKSVIISVAVIGLLYLGWSRMTTAQGAQKVNYVPAQKECFSVEGAHPWKYCVHKAKNEPVNGDIAYLLHGRNQNEDNWNDDTLYTAQIQQYWEERKISPPTVVSVSFGPIWLLTNKATSEKSGLYEVFINEVIPEIEKRIGKPKERLVFGESMGGINSLVLGFKTKDVFQKVASLCPVIAETTPYDSYGKMREFLIRTGADPRIMYGVMFLARDYAANIDEWNNFSPLKIVDQVDPAHSPEFYLSCGLYDKYGNYEGVEKLAQIMKAKNIPVEWHPMYGNHCVVDINSVAEFLVRHK